MTDSVQTYANPDGSTVAVTVGYTYTPAPPRTMFGTTPRGASTASGAAAVDQVYGAGAAIRLYCTGALTDPAVADRHVIGSFKTMPATAQVIRRYDRMFYQHEIDAKVRKGAITLAQWQRDMATLVSLNISALGVCVTADAFVNPAKRPTDYLVDGVTHLGVDFDGINLASGYHDYSAELAAAIAFCAKHGLTWGVPEFGANRAANDVDGSARAAWLTHWGAQFQTAGAEYVCIWEQDSETGSTYTTAAEIATVHAMLALTR